MKEPGYAIQDLGGRRRIDDADFPLAIGGPEAEIQVDDDRRGPFAYLGVSDGEVFVQPSDDHYRVICNGATLESSRWLQPGDVLRFGRSLLTVEEKDREIRFVVGDAGEGADGDGTSPPLIAPPPGRPGAGSPDREAAAAIIEPVRFEPSRKLKSSRPRRGIRPLGVLVVLLLAALLTVAGFLLTSRSVLVEIEPAPDRLAFEGGFALELGGRYLMRPGSYTLRAEKAGFSPLERPVEVTRDTQQTLRFELDKLPGLLVIQTPVEGAEVLIDGESRGTTPLARLELPPGEVEVTVRAERYQDFATRLGIEGGGASQTLEVALAPRWAAVTFASEPAGARVRLDGEELGTTPLTADVLDGAHSYDLLLSGYKPHRGRLEVTAEESQTLAAVRLRPSDGNLALASEPAGATVTVAGAYRGETPLDLYLEPNREVEVSVSKAGYETSKHQVRVASGKSQELSIALRAQEGEVQISSWPGDAELFVDGESRGQANQTLRLQAMPRQIEVKKTGFVPYRQTLTPLPGVPQFIEVTLKPLSEAREEARKAANPSVTTTSEGHELRLIQPGRLRMGASRREPGRRANEILREVELTRPFYLATREVSNRQFRNFLARHASGQVAGHSLEIDHHPAVRVTWEQAAAYCNWLSAKEDLDPAYADTGATLVPAVPMTNGYRLPTEAEWAWAARYGSGESPIKYPWGDSLPVAPSSGNYADTSALGFLPGALSDYNDTFPVTAPVDSFQPDARGLHNLGGNVAEWMHDHYAIRLGGGSQVERDPMGPADGEFHVIRGSSWMHSTVTELRLSFRDYGSDARPDLGFRIARYSNDQ